MGFIRVGLFAYALHDSLMELALVDEEVHVSRDAFPVIHVVGPFSLICLTLDLCEFAIAVGVAKIPGSFIRSAILEAHDATTMSETTKPFAVIGCTRCAIAMHSYLKLLLQLSLAAVPEKINLDYSTLRDGLHGVTDQELLAILSTLISDLLVFNSLELASPVRLNLDNPVGVDAAILTVLICSIGTTINFVIECVDGRATARLKRI